MDLHDVYLAARLAGKNYAHINDTINAAQDKIAINACTLGYTRKNLLKVTASTTTVNGVTMTVDSDGTLTLSGTAIARTVIPITPMSNRNLISDLPTNFILSGGDQMLGAECCIGVEVSTGAGSGYIASFYDGDNGRLVDLSGYPTAKYWYAYMRIYEGVNVDGITIYPMIRPSNISNSDFEPYKPSVTDYITNLEKRIAALEGGTPASILDTNSLNDYEIQNEDNDVFETVAEIRAEDNQHIDGGEKYENY